MCDTVDGDGVAEAAAQQAATKAIGDLTAQELRREISGRLFDAVDTLRRARGFHSIGAWSAARTHIESGIEQLTKLRQAVEL